MALFQKNIDPRCSYCARSRPLDADQVVCDKKGRHVRRVSLPRLSV